MRAQGRRGGRRSDASCPGRDRIVAGPVGGGSSAAALAQSGGAARAEARLNAGPLSVRTVGDASGGKRTRPTEPGGESAPRGERKGRGPARAAHLVAAAAPAASAEMRLPRGPSAKARTYARTYARARLRSTAPPLHGSSFRRRGGRKWAWLLPEEGGAMTGRGRAAAHGVIRLAVGSRRRPRASPRSEPPPKALSVKK